MNELTSGLSSSAVIMGMFWVMATGAGIWVLDNVLKRFENVMEDGFKHQARSLNKSLRINMAIVVISLSLIGYLRFSNINTSELLNSGVMGSVLWFSLRSENLSYTFLLIWFIGRIPLGIVFIICQNLSQMKIRFSVL